MNNNSTESQSHDLAAFRRVPLALWAGLVVLGGVVTGIFAAWVFTGEYNDYRSFPTFFLPPDSFIITVGRPLAITAAVAGFFIAAWVVCALLRSGGTFREGLAADARVFLTLAAPGGISALMATGTDPGIASLFLLMAAVTPPIALLAYRAASRVAGLLPHKRGLSLAVLVLMTAAFCIFFGIQTIRQYHTLNLGYADSGFVAEALSNTLRGRFMWCNSLSFGNYLGDHFSPILLLLVPIYALFPAHEALLAVHSLAIGLGAIPVYLLARRLTKSEFGGLALAAVYLLHPAVQFQNFCFSYAFKASSLAIPLILWAMYFATVRRAGFFVLFGVLALACEESLAPVVLALGIYAALNCKMRAGWLAAGLALGWWAAATQLVMPRIAGGEASKQLRTFYGWMGKSPGAILFFIAQHPRKILKRFLDREVFVFAAQMTLPVAMLCFLSPAALAIGAITFAFLVLSSQPAFLSIYFQYKAGLIPVVFLATAIAMGKLGEWRAGRAIFGSGKDGARAIGCLLVVAAAANCYIFGPTPLSHNYVPSLYRADRYDAVQEMREIIPPDASLLTTERAAAHFTRQPLLHRLSWEPPADYDFVLLDLGDRWGGLEEIFAERKKYLADARYGPVYAREGFILFQKGGRTPDELKAFGPRDPHVLDDLSRRMKIPVGEEAEIVYLYVDRPASGPMANTILHAYWKCLKPIETDRGCVITIVNKSPERTRRFTRVVHPCRGLFPTSLWRPGMVIADRFELQVPFDTRKGETRIYFGWKEWLEPEAEKSSPQRRKERREE